MRLRERISMIYFAQVRGGGPIKIGCSLGPAQRIHGLQAWCPLPLDFLCMAGGGTDEERVIQDALKDFRMHSEWFEPNEKLAAIIAEIIATNRLPAFVAIEVNKKLRERKRLWRSRVARIAWAKKHGKERRVGPNFKKRSPETIKSHREKVAANAARKRADRGAARKLEFALTMNAAA